MQATERPWRNFLCAALFFGAALALYAPSLSDDLLWDDGTLIDNASWAMGTMTEVEPDVVLATYMNAYRDMPLLLQLIRVKKDRIEPVK